ncbi:MAG: hypothetical protein B6U76_00715 [Desulfurococcales archaeon ex4484_217_2]|nr:MAG: hypothetical protein B6U76_00715 [Desulfurococcales archaeon ex4484_217_2]
MKLLIVFERIPNNVIGEDKLLIEFAKYLSKHHEVYLLILSQLKFLNINESSIYFAKRVPPYFDIILLHHDSSFLSKIWRLRKLKVKASTIVGTIYFVDTYHPVSFLRSILGWFVLQAFMPMISFSRYVKSLLQRFIIKRVVFLPFIEIVLRKSKNTCSEVRKFSNKRMLNSVKICYIGSIDSERTNPSAIAKLLYVLSNNLGKNVELILVCRTGRITKRGSKTVIIIPRIKVKLIERTLSEYEKITLLSKCNIALFTAKRIRFLIPPYFLIEATGCNIPIYAPYIAPILRLEGLDNVFERIDELINYLTRSI